MKIVMIDSPTASPWIERINRFRLLEDPLRTQGHDVHLLFAEREFDGLLMLAGLGREGDVLPMIEAQHALQIARWTQPDVCVLPLRGGLAHGILMARECGELRRDMRVILAAEESSRELFLRSDLNDYKLRLIVADAMETFCLEKADSIVGLKPLSSNRFATLQVQRTEHERFVTSSLVSKTLLITSGDKRKRNLAFVGPFERASHVTRFIDAVEALAAAKQMDGRKVLFCGPMNDPSFAVGKTWLGRRAVKWNFPFEIFETSSLYDAFRSAIDANATAFLPDLDLCHLNALLNSAQNPHWSFYDAGQDNSGKELGRLLAGDIPDSTFSDARSLELDADSLGWSSDKNSDRSQSEAGAAPFKLSFCILHHDRPDLLRVAVDSVRRQIETSWTDTDIVILDNASKTEDAKIALEELAAPGVRIVRLETALPVPAAMNALAAETDATFMAFLDDDNVVTDGGVMAIRSACLAGNFDVITSNLNIFDGTQPAPSETVAMLTFIGPASTAGLFFNAFGDTCMAFRHAAFDQLGGFVETSGAYPACDWIILARAQAAGLKIGVLQTPAFQYRRDVHRAQLSWTKYDQHGARQLLLSHYGEKYDPTVLAKLCQSFCIDYS